MMAGVGSWLLSITGASVLCALADGLMPAGPVRRVGRLVCGLVLLAVILAPLAQLDLEGGQRWLEEYHLGLEDRTQELERQVDEQMKTIIEQEYAAYIVDKAAEMGKDCIFAVGNAPTALVRLYELIQEGKIHPKLIIGVPVGFVNVVPSKELIISLPDTPYIVARGRKGGSNVAAAICNALIYQLTRK